MGNTLNEILTELTTGYEISLETFSHLPNLVLILVILGLFWLSKKIFDIFAPFELEYQLVKADNKAVTISFVGYLAGVVVILEGVLHGESISLVDDIISVLIWGVLGILLLNLAGIINDKLILNRFDNKLELVENHNIAVGTVVAGTYLGSSIIIRSIIIGESIGWVLDIGLTFLYFILAQLTFYLYSLLYQIITKYDFHREIKGNNVAAGISLGCNLVAVGVLLSIPLQTSYSLFFYFTWFIIGNCLLAFFRFVMDFTIIPMEKLDEEIHKDQNWGIAMLEGCFSIAAVFIMQVLFA
jgi:uncharacterized membrane protein YjfL (UPF0719 family)